MATVTTNKNHPVELLADNVRIFLQVKSAYEQCDPEIREAVDDMFAIVGDPEALEAEKKRAMATIVDAIFPMLASDFIESCDSVRRTSAAIANNTAMDQEEATFAERVESLMKDRGLNQEQLAERAGVGQPAISNMLKRQCRPQKKTVERIAGALGVQPDDLWPCK